jgi:hypothetical protein
MPLGHLEKLQGFFGPKERGPQNDIGLRNSLSRNSTHYSFPLSSLGRACLSRPRPATNPSPGPRRLKKAASRSTLSPWERADPLCHALRF